MKNLLVSRLILLASLGTVAMKPLTLNYTANGSAKNFILLDSEFLKRKSRMNLIL